MIEVLVRSLAVGNGNGFDVDLGRPGEDLNVGIPSMYMYRHTVIVEAYSTGL